MKGALLLAVAAPGPLEEVLGAGIFYLLAAVTLVSAAVVVLSRNLIHSGFSLLFTLFGVACLYAYMGADFLAAAQVLIYIGGILVLILFGVMLTHRVYGLSLKSVTSQLLPGLMGFLALLVIILMAVLRARWPEATPVEVAPTTARIGEAFLTTYILPFEVASVLLLIALVGAATMVRRREPAE